MELATLVDGTLEPGNHKVVLDAGHLPTGVYIYQLRGSVSTGHSFVQTKKLILLK